MWQLIANLLGGPIISGLLDGYKAKLASVDNADTHAVDLAKAEIAADIQARANAKEIRLATAGHIEVRILFFVLGAFFTVHAGLITIGSDFAGRLSADHWLLHVAALPRPFDQYEALVITFFFGAATVMNSVQSIAGALARRN